MKILQITPTFVPSKLGGIDIYYNLSENLVKRGHEVVVYTTDIQDRYSRLSDFQGGKDIDGIKVRYFKNISNSLATKHRLFLPKGMSITVKKDLRSFDIIHLHNVRTFQNVIVHHYAKKYGIPYVLQAHGSLATYFQKGTLKRTFDRLWGYAILKDASKLIAVTPMEAEQYKSMGISDDKIEIVPNGIDLTEFENLPQKGEFSKRHGLNEKRKIILYLGRIHKIKGLDLLAKAFAHLSKEMDDVGLVIAGPDDGYLPILRELIKELGIEGRTIFTGPLYGRDKLEAYVDAAVYVLPSTYEIFGITVLEAIACGTPVIVTDRCGFAEQVNGTVGQVIRCDVDELQNALLKALTNQKSEESLRNKRESFLERFSWPRIAGEMENIYQAIL